MYFIETERLKLIPLPHFQLTLLEQNRALMEYSMGLRPSNMRIDDLFRSEFNDALQNFWLPQTRSHPKHYEWYTNWEIILKRSNTSIGGMGFGGYPDDNGETMIGYCIDGNEHSQGYGTEALAALVNWASGCADLKGLKIETAASNIPSIKIAIKCGFKQVAVNGDNVILELR